MTTTSDEGVATAPPIHQQIEDIRPLGEGRPGTQVGVQVIAAIGAVVGALSSAEPTGLGILDALWSALLVAAVSLAASRATRLTWLWLAGLAAVAAVGSWALAPAGAGLVMAAASSLVSLRPRLIGAAVGALCGASLLFAPDVGPHGVPSALAAVAVAPVLYSGYRRCRHDERRSVRRVALCLIVFVAIAGLAFTVAAIMAARSLTGGMDNARQGLELVRDGEHEAAGRRFADAEGQFGRADTLLSGPWAWPARAVPVLSQHARAVSMGASSGEGLADVAGEAATTAPYQELKADAGTVDLERVREMQAPVGRTARALRSTRTRLHDVSSPWLVPPVAEALDELEAEVVDTLPEAVLATDALELAPALLGSREQRDYLVLFTSPAESRNLGGFTGSWGVLSAKEGHVDFTVSGNIGDLARSNAAPRSLDEPRFEEFTTRYDRYSPERFFQNFTVSPDMATTGAVTRELFGQTTGFAVDGVVVVDPFAIAAFLELTGPVRISDLGYPLTADNAVQYLLRDQYVQYEGREEDRKDRLEDAGKATFDALTERSLPGPRVLGRVLGPVVAEKRLLFYPFRENEQQLIDDVGALGRFRAPKGQDFLSVRTANTRANKIDSFLHRTIEYRVSYDTNTGEARATATVVLRNDAPAAGLPPYIIGDERPELDNLPPGTSRLNVQVYSPLDGGEATVDGEPVSVEHQRELGLNVYSQLVTIPPGGTRTFEIDLSGTIEAGSYRLFASSQPLPNPDSLSVVVEALRGGPDVSAARGLEVTGGEGRRGQEAWTRDESFTASFE